MIRRLMLVTLLLSIALPAMAQEPVETLTTVPNEAWPRRSVHWAPGRPITRPPGYHWFGYYDKHQFDPSGRYVLGMRADFQDRSPSPEDVIEVGMIDLHDNDRWIRLGESRSWNWQQGCMLQWRPGTDTEVLWNDREDGRFVCRIIDIATMKTRTIPSAIYTVSPDGRIAMTLDFERVQDMRPGYGYAGLSDPHADDLAPDDAGIYRVDLETGERELVISVADMLDYPFPRGSIDANKHYFNHLLFSPDGSRFIFLNRWRINEFRASNPTTPFDTRMMTARPDGSDIQVVDDYGYTSHFIWRDPGNILAWARRASHGDAFYLFDALGERDPEIVGAEVMTRNGHCTYLPDTDWILNDTYPDADRLQQVYLYHVPTGNRVPVASVYLSPDYPFDNEIRVDTHPRISNDGRFVCIDSPHDGAGRQLYLFDISGIEALDLK